MRALITFIPAEIPAPMTMPDLMETGMELTNFLPRPVVPMIRNSTATNI